MSKNILAGEISGGAFLVTVVLFTLLWSAIVTNIYSPPVSICQVYRTKDVSYSTTYPVNVDDGYYVIPSKEVGLVALKIEGTKVFKEECPDSRGGNL